MKKLWILAVLMLAFSGCSENDGSSAAQKSNSALQTVTLSSMVDTTTATTTTTAPVEGAVLPGATASPQESQMPSATTTATATESSTTQTESGDADNIQDATFSSSDLHIDFRGVTLKPDIDINTVLASLGTPDSQYSAPSCNYDGDDKTFIFGDVTIYTYPAGNADKILEIEVCGNSVSASRGGAIGMTQQQISEIYGSGFTTEGSTMRYTASGAHLYFYIENGVVSSFGIASE